MIRFSRYASFVLLVYWSRLAFDDVRGNWSVVVVVVVVEETAWREEMREKNKASVKPP